MLALLSFTINAMVVRADDIYLVGTVFYDTPIHRGMSATNNIYVLLLPLHTDGKLESKRITINPVVFKTFDTNKIVEALRVTLKSGELAPGSVFHFQDNDRLLETPPREQINTLMDSCKELGLTVRKQ